MYGQLKDLCELTVVKITFLKFTNATNILWTPDMKDYEISHAGLSESVNILASQSSIFK